MKKEIFEIVNKVGRISSESSFDEEDIAEEITDYIERNYYPKEFIKWWITCDSQIYTFEDIYEHWINKVMK